MNPSADCRFISLPFSRADGQQLHSQHRVCTTAGGDANYWHHNRMGQLVQLVLSVKDGAGSFVLKACRAHISPAARRAVVAALLHEAREGTSEGAHSPTACIHPQYLWDMPEERASLSPPNAWIMIWMSSSLLPHRNIAGSELCNRQGTQQRLQAPLKPREEQ